MRWSFICSNDCGFVFIWHVGSFDGCHGDVVGDAAAVDGAVAVVDGAAAVDGGAVGYYDVDPDVDYDVGCGAGCGVGLDAGLDAVLDVDSDAVDVDWYG